MQTVTRTLRWLALATVAFFIIALLTDTAVSLATPALVVMVAAVIVTAIIDLAMRRR